MFGFAFGSCVCVCICMCVYFQKGRVMSSVGICTPPSLIRLVVRFASCPMTVIFIALSSQLLAPMWCVEGGVYCSHIHLSFVCLMWHLY